MLSICLSPFSLFQRTKEHPMFSWRVFPAIRPQISFLACWSVPVLRCSLGCRDDCDCDHMFQYASISTLLLLSSTYFCPYFPFLPFFPVLLMFTCPSFSFSLSFFSFFLFFFLFFLFLFFFSLSFSFSFSFSFSYSFPFSFSFSSSFSFSFLFFFFIMRILIWSYSDPTFEDLGSCSGVVTSSLPQLPISVLSGYQVISLLLKTRALSFCSRCLTSLHIPNPFLISFSVRQFSFLHIAI